MASLETHGPNTQPGFGGSQPCGAFIPAQRSVQYVLSTEAGCSEQPRAHRTKAMKW